MQIPKEARDAFPRLSEPLTSEDTQQMLDQSLEILQNEKMQGSHALFCDVIRLILALQLSVAEANFTPEKTELPKTGLNIILPE